MFIRQHMRKIDGKSQWSLVESFRTQAGPRQRVVAWLGRLDEAGRLGSAACGRRFEERIEKRLVARTERCAKQKRTPAAVERDVGRLLGQNTLAA